MCFSAAGRARLLAWLAIAVEPEHPTTISIDPGAHVLYAATDKGAVLRFALPPD
jgi:hypothetical protein